MMSQPVTSKGYLRQILLRQILLFISGLTVFLMSEIGAQKFWLMRPDVRTRAKEKRKELRPYVTIDSAAKDFHESLGEVKKSSPHKYHPHRHRAVVFQRVMATAMRIAHEQSHNSDGNKENVDPHQIHANAASIKKITAKTVLDTIAKTGDYVMRGKEPGMLEILEKIEIVKRHRDITDHPPTKNSKGRSVFKQFPLSHEHFSSHASSQEGVEAGPGFPGKSTHATDLQARTTAHTAHNYKVTNIPIKFENYANIRYMELTATVVNVKDLPNQGQSNQQGSESGTTKGSGAKGSDSDTKDRKLSEDAKEARLKETVKEARSPHKITQIRYALMNVRREVSSMIGTINVYSFTS